MEKVHLRVHFYLCRQRKQLVPETECGKQVNFCVAAGVEAIICNFTVAPMSMLPLLAKQTMLQICRVMLHIDPGYRKLSEVAASATNVLVDLDAVQRYV